MTTDEEADDDHASDSSDNEQQMQPIENEREREESSAVEAAAPSDVGQVPRAEPTVREELPDALFRWLPIGRRQSRDDRSESDSDNTSSASSDSDDSVCIQYLQFCCLFVLIAEFFRILDIHAEVHRKHLLLRHYYQAIVSLSYHTHHKKTRVG